MKTHTHKNVYFCFFQLPRNSLILKYFRHLHAQLESSSDVIGWLVWPQVSLFSYSLNQVAVFYTGTVKQIQKNFNKLGDFMLFFLSAGILRRIALHARCGIITFCASCWCVVLRSFFFVGGLGVEEHHNSLREVPTLLQAISFCGVGPQTKSSN